MTSDEGPELSGREQPFQDALLFWLKLGSISFGGPAGQIAVMHHELVEKRRWISECRFLHAWNYCMLLPGPEAQQLDTCPRLAYASHLGRHLPARCCSSLAVLPACC